MIPSFAVVGHPNKGKSSIVSTLARDDRVAVSMQSGTTVVSEAIDVHVGQSSYRLYDTPGFQRPRKVLAWLNTPPPSADKRADRIKEFLKDEECCRIFKDEIELLKPIMNGAAILYVVDCSRKYSPEYEPEMEILRWTGQPCMALINPIENRDHIDSWQSALGQFFRITREFNAVQADINQHISLLQDLSTLDKHWSTPLKALINSLENEISQQRYRSCYIAASLLEDQTKYQLSQKLPTKPQAKTAQAVLEQKYYQWMRQREKQAHNDLQALYSHHHLKRDTQTLTLPNDLFDTSQWFLWGLSRSQLTKMAGIAGAVVGSSVDFALGGSTFGLGAISTGIISSSTAWFGASKLAQTSISGLPLGGYQSSVGPIRSQNYPYVILGRFINIYKSLHRRNHAQRADISVADMSINDLIDRLSADEKKKLVKAVDNLIKQKRVSDLTDTLKPLIDLLTSKT